MVNRLQRIIISILLLTISLSTLAALQRYIRPSSFALAPLFRPQALVQAHPRNFTVSVPVLQLPIDTHLQAMSVKSAVDKHIAENHVVVFSKSYCPYCKKAKGVFESLNEKAAVFELDELEEGSDWQAYLADKTGQRTVPSIFIDGKFIGGSSDLESANKSGELKKLLAQ